MSLAHAYSAEVFQRQSVQRATVGHAGAPIHTPVLLPISRRVVEGTQRAQRPRRRGVMVVKWRALRPGRTVSAPSVTVISHDDVDQAEYTSRNTARIQVAKQRGPHFLTLGPRPSPCRQRNGNRHPHVPVCVCERERERVVYSRGKPSTCTEGHPFTV